VEVLHAELRVHRYIQVADDHGAAREPGGALPGPDVALVGELPHRAQADVDHLLGEALGGQANADRVVRAAADASPFLEPLLQTVAALGEEDEAAEAIEEILTRSTAQPSGGDTDIDSLLPVLKQRMKEDQIIERFQQPEEEGGFKDIWDNPHLRRIAYDETERLIEEGAPFDDWKTYQKAGEIVREYAKFKASQQTGEETPKEDNPTPPKTETKGLEQRREKKRTIDTPRPASSQNQSDKDLTPKKQTASDIINEIKKARGQA